MQLKSSLILLPIYFADFTKMLYYVCWIYLLGEGGFKMPAKEIIKKAYDVVIVGGGMSGVCAALASARHGASTALIQNRPVLGGNASSEIRMHICGADNHGRRKNARETGIIEEILLENRKRNPQYSYSIFDTILWEKTRFQEGLDLYLNTHMNKVFIEEEEIKAIRAEQLTTEKVFEFTADIYVDTTGDGSLAYLAGADFMVGRESKEAFGEKYAPDKSDHHTMGNTILFKTRDMGEPVPFVKPDWANTYTEEDLAHRDHGASGHNYWWIELGGGEFDTIADAEEIRDELLKAVYGVWDHIKNGGDHGADNYVLDWVGFLPGKRESRRIKGDYILKEQDLLEGKIFDDAVAYGGWPMDMHVVGGLETCLEPTNFIQLDDVYTIPYRSLYSKDINNLMMGGRIISASHMAFGSTRVMATCSVIGQAVGTGAALAIEKGIKPGDVMDYMAGLQQKLMKDDVYIPGFKNEDKLDLARKANVSASSNIPGGEPEQVANGYARQIKGDINGWVSEEIGDEGEYLSLEFAEAISPSEIHLRFDSNLSKEIMISMFDSTLADQIPGIPAELVKDYRIEFYQDDRLVVEKEVRDNYLRFNKHIIDQNLTCNKIKIKVLATNGDKYARIFEVRVY